MRMTRRDGLPLEHLGCRLYRSAVLTLTTATSTPIVWDSAVRDPLGLWHGDERIVIPFRGLWRVKSQLLFATNATGQRQNVISITGATTASGIGIVTPGTNVTPSVIADEDYVLEAGSVIQINGFQDSGVSLNLNLAVANNYVNVAPRRAL